MKKVQWMTIVSCLFLVAFCPNLWADCVGSECGSFGQGIEINYESTAHAWGTGDNVTLDVASSTLVNASIGDIENGDGMEFTTLGLFSVHTEGSGDLVAGGEATGYLDYNKLDRWGFERVPTEDDCGTGCNKQWFDETEINFRSGGNTLAYGGEVEAVNVGVLGISTPLGDPSDGNQFDFVGGWNSSSIGESFKEVNGGIDGRVHFRKIVEIRNRQ